MYNMTHKSNMYGEDIIMQINSLTSGDTRLLGQDFLSPHVADAYGGSADYITKLISDLFSTRIPIAVIMGKDDIVGLYKFLISDIYNQFAVGVINYTNANKDDIIRRYYLDSPYKSQLDADIKNMQFTLALDADKLVILLFLNNIIGEFVRSVDTACDYFDRTMINRISAITGLDSIRIKQMIFTFPLGELEPNIHLLINKVYPVVSYHLLRPEINQIMTSQFYTLLSKWGNAK